MSQLRHRLRLDLTDPLSSDVEVLAEFFERLGFVAVKPEPKHEDVSLALVESGERNVEVGPIVVELRFDKATL